MEEAETQAWLKSAECLSGLHTRTRSYWSLHASPTKPLTSEEMPVRL